MATVEHLPPEVLAYLLSFLQGKEIGRVSGTCRHFREAAKVESVWQRRCREEYGIDYIKTNNNVTFFELYSQLLCKYGHILGVWQPDVGPYGGLVVVKYVGDHIEGIQYLPPVNPHLLEPTRERKLFTAGINDDRLLTVTCHGGYGGSHPCSILQLEVETNVFSCKCDEPEFHRHPSGQEAGFTEWLSMETDNDLQNFLFHGQELLLMKYLITSKFATSSTFIRLELPRPNPDNFEIIRPGIFKGSYGNHGIELMMLSYENNHETMHIKKISGDPNVPAGQISLKVDLVRPMILTLEQQSSIQNLLDIDTPDIPAEVTLDKLPPQPFRIPADCFDRNLNPANTCTARFYSQGQIAGHGFSEPSFTPGHFMVFDQDTFGHLWMKLESFSLYSRVKEDIM